MRKIKTILRYITLAICLFLLAQSVAAQDADFEFDVSALPDKDQEKRKENLYIEYLVEIPVNAAIHCFDVNSKGMYVLCFDQSTHKTIGVYSATGELQYGLRIRCEGICAVQLSEQDGLSVYLDRSHLLAVFDADGKCLRISEVPLTSHNRELADTLIYRTQKQNNGQTYRLERDLPLGPGYSRLVVVDENGVKIVLYDVSLQQNLRIILVSAFFITVMFLSVYNAFVKRRAY